MGELINLPIAATVTDTNFEREQPAKLYRMPGEQPLLHDDLASYEQRIGDRLKAQAKALELAQADGHPVITASRNFLNSDKELSDLGATMVGALPAAHYLTDKFGQPLSETLDELAMRLGHKELPATYKELKKYWAGVYMYGTGVFNMEQLTDGIDPDNADHFSVRRDVNRAMLLLQEHPVAFMNCLAAARACAVEDALEDYWPYLQGNYGDGEDMDRNRDLLHILASAHVTERPFATWYLLNMSAQKDGGMAYVRPLLETIGDSEVGKLRTKHDARMTPLLDNINDSVKYAVRSKWNRFGVTAHTFYRHDFDGHIDGALHYGDTALAVRPVWSDHDRTRKYDRDFEKLRSNLGAMTAQLVKYGKVRPAL